MDGSARRPSTAGAADIRARWSVEQQIDRGGPREVRAADTAPVARIEVFAEARWRRSARACASATRLAIGGFAGLGQAFRDHPVHHRPDRAAPVTQRIKARFIRRGGWHQAADLARPSAAASRPWPGCVPHLPRPAYSGKKPGGCRDVDRRTADLIERQEQPVSCALHRSPDRALHAIGADRRFPLASPGPPNRCASASRSRSARSRMALVAISATRNGDAASILSGCQPASRNTSTRWMKRWYSSARGRIDASTCVVSRRCTGVVVVVGTRASAASQAGLLSMPVSQGCSIDTSPLPAGSRACCHQRCDASSSRVDRRHPRLRRRAVARPIEHAAHRARQHRRLRDAGRRRRMLRAPHRRDRGSSRRTVRGTRSAAPGRRPIGLPAGAPLR